MEDCLINLILNESLGQDKAILYFYNVHIYSFDKLKTEGSHVKNIMSSTGRYIYCIYATNLHISTNRKGEVTVRVLV